MALDWSGIRCWLRRRAIEKRADHGLGRSQNFTLFSEKSDFALKPFDLPIDMVDSILIACHATTIPCDDRRDQAQAWRWRFEPGDGRGTHRHSPCRAPS
jgi:hypothetical protein